MQHYLIAELQMSLDVVEGSGIRCKMKLHVVTVLLLGVVGVDELFATKALNLFERGTVGFEFFGNFSYHFINAFFLALKFQDVNPFVITFHEV